MNGNDDGQTVMAKRYTDELAEWVKKRDASRPRQDRNVVAFLAVRADVEAAMDAGYALKTVWEHLHETGKIPYRYETFLNHVRRHITPKIRRMPATLAACPVKDSRPAIGAPASARTAEPKKTEVPNVGGFTFDPSPNQEELL
jgi:hypothetical protein